MRTCPIAASSKRRATVPDPIVRRRIPALVWRMPKPHHVAVNMNPNTAIEQAWIRQVSPTTFRPPQVRIPPRPHLATDWSVERRLRPSRAEVPANTHRFRAGLPLPAFHRIQAPPSGTMNGDEIGGNRDIMHVSSPVSPQRNSFVAKSRRAFWPWRNIADSGFSVNFALLGFYRPSRVLLGADSPWVPLSLFWFDLWLLFLRGLL